MDETIVNRLLILMEAYGFSAGAFADKIEVQRSSISHLMSGRNKPSLDFVQKVLLQFPDINPSWLIMGKGPMKQLNLFDEVGKAAEPAPLPPIIASKFETPTESINTTPSASQPEITESPTNEVTPPISSPTVSPVPVVEETISPSNQPVDSPVIPQVSAPPVQVEVPPAPIAPSTTATIPATPTVTHTPTIPNPNPSTKKAVKIVFFYDDHTFETFYPSN